MTRSICASPIDHELLEQYWLGELEASREASLEEHLFGCAACAARLQDLVGLADGIRAMVRGGDAWGVVSQEFIERLARQGLHLREYPVAPGGSVNCTVAPDDDLVIARLQAPLTGVTRIDLVVSDKDAVEQCRLRDVQFNPDAGEIIYLHSTAHLRTLGVSTMRIQLQAMDQADPIRIGEYTFRHSPWGNGDGMS